MGDLASLMTPEQVVTPLVSPKGAAAREAGGASIAGAQKALNDTCGRTQELSRRSLAVQQRPSAAHRGDAAMKAVQAFGRRSLAQLDLEAPEDAELLQGAVQSAVRRASNRHRRSVTKAVEVLEEVAEATDEPLEKWSEDKMDAKVELIQQAMEEAYKRHRRSIVAAVQGVVDDGKAPGTEVQESKSVEDALEALRASRDSFEGSIVAAVHDVVGDVLQARIQSAVASAYQRHCAATPASSGQCWPQDWTSGYNADAATSSQTYGDSATYQQCQGGWCQDSSRACQAYSSQWYPDDAAAYQSSSNQWHPEQQWCEGDGGYAPTNDTWDIPWDSRPLGFRQAPWRYGSG